MINFVPKGWGFEKWIVNNEKYCGKLLFFVKGKRCSLHYHKLKDETFYIQSGKIELRYFDNIDKAKPIIDSEGASYFKDYYCTTIILHKGDSFHVAPGMIHQMTALEDTELFEFSTQHFDDDSYRLMRGD